MITLKNLKNTGKKVAIKFAVTGKDILSKGYHIGLDGFSLNPRRTYIPDWYLLGPFSNPRKIAGERRGLDSVYLPERLVNLNMDYHSSPEKQIRWKYVVTPESGGISLTDHFSPSEQVVSYAVTYLYSPAPSVAYLMIGTDDGAKVFLNGKQEYRFLGERIAEPDQAEVLLALNAGWNTLLLKIENNFGDYGFYARLVDPGSLVTASALRTLPSSKVK